MKKHFSFEDLEWFLDHKHYLSETFLLEYGQHLDVCTNCWELWNELRWNRSLKSKGVLELQEYLGAFFRPYFDSTWALARRWNKNVPKTHEQISNFYKNATEYIYNLTIWYESKDRLDFQSDFSKFKNEFKINSVIDYGCGVGNDGLALLELGFKVFFIDYDCPSTHFLKWRLKKRNLNAVLLDVEKIMTFPEADMLWAIDVLEHMDDPLSVVEKLPDSIKLFVHRSKFNNTASGRHPCHLRFDEELLVDALKKKGFYHVPWPKLSVWYKE